MSYRRGPSLIGLVALNYRFMLATGIDPRDPSRIPTAVREHHRSLVRGVYRGARKGFKAWRRFARVCMDEGRKLREAAS